MRQATRAEQYAMKNAVRRQEEGIMTEREWMDEGIDFKLIALLYRKRIWISIVCALAGAVFASGLYFIVHVVYAPAREYEAVSKLYLTFAADDDGDAYQYYNGYTWNDLMGTEPILDKTMETLGADYDRETVKTYVAADILSDIRLLTVTVTTNDPSQTDAVLRATESSLVSFGQEMAEFDKIEVIEHGQAALVVLENETVRAAVAGLAIGFILSLLWLAFVCVMDDSVYVPSDFEKRYGYPVLGVSFAGKPDLAANMLDEHISLAAERCERIVYLDTGLNEVRIPEEAKDGNAGIILQIPYGRKNGRLLERWIAETRLYSCQILGAVITEADEKLYRLYFAAKGA